MKKYSRLCASLISILGLAACGGGGDESSSKAPGVVIEQAVNSPQFLTSQVSNTPKQFAINGTYRQYQDPQGRFLGGDVPAGQGSFQANVTVTPLETQEIVFDNGSREGPLDRFNIRLQETFRNETTGAVSTVTTDHLFYLDEKGRVAYTLLAKDEQLNRCYGASTKNEYPAQASSGQSVEISRGNFAASCSGARSATGNAMFYGWQYLQNFENNGFTAYCLVGFEVTNAFTLDDRQDAYCFEVLRDGSIGARFFYNQSSDSNTVIQASNF